MLPLVKSLLFLAFSSSIVLAGPCCKSCETDHRRESDKTPFITEKRYPQLLIFVSFSMPMEALKTLAKQINSIGGAVIFRGLVNGIFKDTALKLKEMGQEALIDPTLFEAYGIQNVTTFILRKTTTETADNKASHDRLAGNVSLTHVLEQFS